jgi:UDP-N-acetyl-D-glucosamine dehydrogenase
MATADQKSATHRHVLVIGQGYVGLTLAHRAVPAGHTVIGFDTDADEVDQPRPGRAPRINRL